MIGQHGLGKANEASLDLLSFCAMNNLALMNIFQKNDIYKQMWQHPGIKAWHCIDFIVMRQHQRKKCLDVQVMRGAECWTDHQMVRATANVDMGHTKKTRKKEARSRPHGKHNDETIQLLLILGRHIYDSVPRAAMWHVLEKYGIPPTMASLIR